MVVRTRSATLLDTFSEAVVIVVKGRGSVTVPGPAEALAVTPRHAGARTRKGEVWRLPSVGDGAAGTSYLVAFPAGAGTRTPGGHVGATARLARRRQRRLARGLIGDASMSPTLAFVVVTWVAIVVLFLGLGAVLREMRLLRGQAAVTPRASPWRRPTCPSTAVSRLAARRLVLPSREDEINTVLDEWTRGGIRGVIDARTDS
jgi:hypothetical protein